MNIYRNLEELISLDESLLVEIINNFEVISRFFIPWKSRMTGEQHLCIWLICIELMYCYLLGFMLTPSFSVRSLFNDTIETSTYDPWKGVDMTVTPDKWKHDIFYMYVF